MYEIRKINRVVNRVIAKILIIFMLSSFILPFISQDMSIMAKNVDNINIIITNKNLFKSYIRKREVTNIDTSSDEIEEIVTESETETDAIREYIDMKVPPNKVFKSYMDEQYITNKASNQYVLKHQYELDNTTGIYMVDDRYCCALGSYYTTAIGQKFDVVMKSGDIIPCILADCKDDAHTDALKQYTVANGSVVEFVVNEEILIPKISVNGNNTGDVSRLEGIFKGEIDYIRIYQ